MSTKTAVPKTSKTTLGGALEVVAVVVGLIGINFTPEQQGIVLTAAGILYGIGCAVKSYFTADKE